MRIAPNHLIRDLWNNSGPFIGDAGATHGRVTVETGWQLRSGAGPSGFKKGPIRWFQRSDNSQTETEIPNIKSIDIDSSIDTDAANCHITLYNQKMLAMGATPITGTQGESVEQPGYYTFNRGESVDSQDLWGWTTNSWHNVLVPNALVRTYQGYGGKSKTIGQALTDGNLIQTGLWLIDDIAIDAKTGTLTLNCRDMMKLAIDQEIYEPLIPATGSEVHYPLYYYRWKELAQDAIPYGHTVYKVGWSPIDGALTSPTSTSTLEGSSINGHTKDHATDGEDADTFWLSGGHVTGNTGADLEWIEWVTSNITFDGFSIYPYLGNYIVYVSVYTGGGWQGTTNVPYTGTAFTGSYEPKIPYVEHFKVSWESPEIRYLANTYTGVTKIRLTFVNLAKTTVGPKFYRCGIRQVAVGNSTKTVTGDPKFVVDIMAASRTEDDGYWIVGNDGGVFTYGPNLKFFGSEGSHALDKKVSGGFSAGDGLGYMLVAEDGGAFAFGDVPYEGSLPGSLITATDVIDIEMGTGSPAHKGYWILRRDGTVYAYGTAPYYGNYGGSAPAVSMARCDAHGGYWITNLLGNVEAHGGASYHGGSPSLSGNLIISIEGTDTGNGYWLAATDGAVYAYGDAAYYGGMNGQPINGNIVGMARTYDSNGYWLIGEEGGVYAFGDANYWGSLPQQYDFSANGNYSDYADIIRDLLLWAGWWFYTPSLGNSSPAVVFGNIENTGIYSPEPLTEDFFDKTPIIDVINKLKEVVGYIVRVDETGAFHFESPNIWSIGNFLENGVPTAYMFNVAEDKQIIDYQLGYSAQDARSTITIASADPQAKYPDTVSTTITSQWGSQALRGILKPTLWINGSFVDKTVQKNMAKLIDLHLYMASRQGSVTIPGNPLLQINDQIRIFERTTSDTYIHYLRGYHSSMDLETGKWTMTLQTHWMGDGDDWFLTYGPQVNNVDPATGNSGTSVAIDGSGFAGATAVTFGGVNASSFTVNDDSSITATAPAHANGIVDIRVAKGTAVSAVSSTDEFTYA